jgi:uncharacterized membrane protein
MGFLLAALFVTLVFWKILSLLMSKCFNASFGLFSALSN